MATRVVVATAADAPRLWPLLEGFYAEEGFALDDEVRRALERLLADRSLGRVFLIEDGGDTVGYVALCFGFSLEFRGRDACVDEMYVAPSHRGRGLGREALAFALEAARREGVRTAYLEAARAEERLHRLYRSLGFEERPHSLMTKRLDR
jgi:GNAT superfamily N-acetyltransferase